VGVASADQYMLEFFENIVQIWFFWTTVYFMFTLIFSLGEMQKW